MGRSILAVAKEGEKGVSGVPGPLVPPEVRLKIWRWDVVAAGDWREDEPDFRDAFDCDVDRDGFPPFGALSFLEKSPIMCVLAALSLPPGTVSAGFRARSRVSTVIGGYWQS